MTVHPKRFSFAVYRYVLLKICCHTMHSTAWLPHSQFTYFDVCMHALLICTEMCTSLLAEVSLISQGNETTPKRTFAAELAGVLPLESSSTSTERQSSNIIPPLQVMIMNQCERNHDLIVTPYLKVEVAAHLQVRNRRNYRLGVAVASAHSSAS